METLRKKARAVKFDKYGGIDVLHIDEVPVPVPKDDQVLVRVKAAGINPGEAAIRQGYMDKKWPAHFPSGQGSDFAGVIERVGDKVDKFKAGDEVIGFTDDRASQAEYVTVDANHLIRRPSHVSWEQAGALFVVGTTAYAAIHAVGLKEGETLVVSGAAGGVGSIVVQLARNLGARVIGLASKSNHGWITKHGGIPVTYGEGMTERIRTAAAQGTSADSATDKPGATQQAAGHTHQAAGSRIDAFIDTYGHGYVDIALALGVKPERIDTIIDFEAAYKYHVKTEGNAQGAKASVLAELANLIDKGRLEIPIARIYNLNDVRDAYQELEKRHTHGKIVLVP
ncbi:MAG TPA: NADP-dependent oxidoreductase [Puia sp.]|nr:NADP-dependent oxidoreductase [Puia sp.]